MDLQSSGIKDFSEFDIVTKTGFEGDRIFPEQILGEPIIVHFYKIDPSKKKGKEGTDWLSAQITYNKEKRLLWSGSTYLMNALKNIPEVGFPFKAKIIRVNQRQFEFRGINN